MQKLVVNKDQSKRTLFQFSYEFRYLWNIINGSFALQSKEFKLTHPTFNSLPFIEFNIYDMFL